MSRELLTLVVPLVLPTVLYLLWLRARSWPEAAGPVAWHRLPWIWLVATGVALTAIVLFVVTVGFGIARPGTYVPAHVVNGQIVPGKIEPRKP